VVFDIIAVLGGILISPLVLAGLAFTWWQTHGDRNRLEQIWSRYAQRRRLRFVPSTGEWPNRTAPAVQWVEGTAEYRIEAHGAEAVVATGVVARPEVAMLGELSLRRAAPGDVLAVVTGDARIDGRFVVEAKPESLATRLLTAEVRRGLLGFDLGGTVSLTYRRGDVALRWSGAEENDARLDEARGVVRHLVLAIERESGSRRGEVGSGGLRTSAEG
jgi:hypothetical protein